MMRFEIQDMVSQTDQGVTFLAEDKQTQDQVALRRFLLQGQIAETLSDQRIADYRETCHRLSGVRHPGLRAVIEGGVDSTDNTPYLVTEWIEGHRLPDILAGQTMDAGHTLDVVRVALEVSLALSEAFGEQGVWIDTGPESIIVDAEEGGRGYTFWVSPVRWFDARTKLREVRTVAKLAEELMGWNRRAYSETSGGGFGAWIKAVKANPQITVEQALDQLSLIGKTPVPTPNVEALEAPPEAVAEPVQPKVAAPGAPLRPGADAKPAAAPKMVIPGAVPQASATGGTRALASPNHSALSAAPAPAPSPQPTFSALSSNPPSAQPTHTAQETQPVLVSAAKAGSSKVPMIIIGVFALAVAGLGWLAYSKRAAPENDLASKESPGLDQPLETPSASDAGTAPPSADAAQPEPNRVMAEVTSAKSHAGNQETPFAQAPLFAFDDTEGIQKLANGAHLRVRGTLHSSHLTSASKNLILYFSEPPVAGQIRAVAYSNLFEGSTDPKNFESFMGKEVVIGGALRKSKDAKNPPQITFNQSNQIWLAENATQSGSDGEKIALTPDQYGLIAKLPNDQPVLLQGEVRDIRVPEHSNCMQIQFTGPADKQQIKVVACRSQFNGMPLTREELLEIVESLQFLVGKTIRVDGVVSRWEGKTEPHFVSIVRQDQIAVRE